jgi:6-phosphogluconate dehydrogenase
VPDKDGKPLVDRILDVAGQKGTGLWTGISALELGVPLSSITEAVFVRALSVRRDERLQAAATLGRAPAPDRKNKEAVIAAVHDALYAAKIVSYAQGFMLLQDAAQAFNWPLEPRDIALIWRGGCIIRSVFLNDIAAAYQNDPSLVNLLLAPFFTEQLRRVEPGWRQAVTLGLGRGVPLPAMAAALTFFDGYRCARLPANLLQAQRDFFGAHTYERIDRPRGAFFHTDWSSLAAMGKGPLNDD